MFKVAIDLGYGYVKGINENGKTVLIRTAVGSATNRQLSNIFDRSSKTKEHIIITENGLEKQYFIGDLARCDSKDCSSPFEKNKIDNQSNKVLMAAAFAMLVEDNRPVHLVTGPPLLYITEQKDSFKKVLTEYSSALQFVGEEKIHAIKFERVTIFPQGAAALHYLLHKQPELAKPNRSFAIIEVGYKTTEILVFKISKEGKIIPVNSSSTTLELGMNLVERSLGEALFQKTGAKFNLSTLDTVLRDDPVISFRGKEINLQEEVDNAKDSLARNITDGMIRVLGDQIEFISKIIFAGGVIQDEYIKNRIKAILKSDFFIVEDSQFANARGMLEVARMIESREGK